MLLVFKDGKLSHKLGSQTYLGKRAKSLIFRIYGKHKISLFTELHRITKSLIDLGIITILKSIPSSKFLPNHRSQYPFKKIRYSIVEILRIISELEK